MRDDHIAQRDFVQIEVFHELPAQEVGDALLRHLAATRDARVDQVPVTVRRLQHHAITLPHVDEVELEQGLSFERALGDPAFSSAPSFDLAA